MFLSALSTSFSYFDPLSAVSSSQRIAYDFALVQSAVQIALNAIYIAVYYPVTRYIISRKLNLE
jgi:hypothetical protein